jgi:hypothetical protein
LRCLDYGLGLGSGRLRGALATLVTELRRGGQHRAAASTRRLHTLSALLAEVRGSRILVLAAGAAHESGAL